MQVTETLRLVSIQHELAMALGHDLRLRPMLEHFSQVCLRRLSLRAVHVYLRTELGGEWQSQEGWRSEPARHFLSLPSVTSEFPHGMGPLSGVIRNVERAPAHSSMAYGGRVFQIFCLDELGFLILERGEVAIEASVVAALLPIMARLSISCCASLQHENSLREVAARVEAEARIRYQAYYDELTGLPNRRMLMESLERDILRCQRHGHFGALLFLDLDNFKTINDSLGHSVGDRLLQEMASRLNHILRQDDACGRLGGDEFVVLLSEVSDELQDSAEQTQRLANKIQQRFLPPFSVLGHTLHVTSSIGIALFPADGTSIEDVLKHADTAMYQAKAAGKNAVRFFQPDMSMAVHERLALEKAMRNALDANEFFLQYQPQFNREGGIIGAEALIRWARPGHGIVAPNSFIVHQQVKTTGFSRSALAAKMVLQARAEAIWTTDMEATRCTRLSTILCG